eukprot:5377033-Prymnesium_polylepis.1
MCVRQTPPPRCACACAKALRRGVHVRAPRPSAAVCMCVRPPPSAAAPQHGDWQRTEFVHRVLFGHAVDEALAEARGGALEEGLPQRVGRRAHPDHLVQLLLPVERRCSRLREPARPRRQVGVRQAPVGVIGQRHVGEAAASGVREGERLRVPALERARLVAAVDRDVHVGQVGVQLEQLEQRPREDGCAA